MDQAYNDLRDLDLSIDAVERLVGQATRSMDADLLNEATMAINDVKRKLSDVIAQRTGVDDEFLKRSQTRIAQVEEQLSEAKD